MIWKCIPQLPELNWLLVRFYPWQDLAQYRPPQLSWTPVQLTFSWDPLFASLLIDTFLCYRLLHCTPFGPVLTELMCFLWSATGIEFLVFAKLAAAAAQPNPLATLPYVNMFLATALVICKTNNHTQHYKECELKCKCYLVVWWPCFPSCFLLSVVLYISQSVALAWF